MDPVDRGQFGSFSLELWSSLITPIPLGESAPCLQLCVRGGGCYTVHTPTLSPLLQGGQGSASRSGAPTPAWPSPVCSWCASSGGPSRLGPSLQVCLYQGNLPPSQGSHSPEASQKWKLLWGTCRGLQYRLEPAAQRSLCYVRPCFVNRKGRLMRWGDEKPSYPDSLTTFPLSVAVCQLRPVSLPDL